MFESWVELEEIEFHKKVLNLQDITYNNRSFEKSNKM